MKETLISNCERSFVTQAVRQNRRLDGRKNDEFRNLQINFGADFGSVLVSLGETKVLGQVSCELGIPKATRPHEGMMFINVELGPMAAPYLESGRNSELGVKVTRTLERTFKDSRCVDLESLCVTAEEKVWILRVDLSVLCHEGNVIDCCSIATLCALAHFKRPDVSIIEDQVHIHTAAEKEPISVVLHHYPICVSYCTFDDGRVAVADPIAIEERTSDSEIIFGLNAFRELCCLNLGGSNTLPDSYVLIQCAQKAAVYAKKIVEHIKKELENDINLRKILPNTGFTECLRLNKLTGLAENRLTLKLRHFKYNLNTYEQKSTDNNASKAQNISEVKWLPADMLDENNGSESYDGFPNYNQSSESNESNCLQAELSQNLANSTENEIGTNIFNSDSEDEQKIIL